MQQSIFSSRILMTANPINQRNRWVSSACHAKAGRAAAIKIIRSMSVQENGERDRNINEADSNFWPDASCRPILERGKSLEAANSPQQVLFEMGVVVAIMLLLSLIANVLILYL